MMADFTYYKKNILYSTATCFEELCEKLDCIPYAFINQIEMSQDSQKVNGNPLPKYYLILTHLSSFILTAGIILNWEQRFPFFPYSRDKFFVTSLSSFLLYLPSWEGGER